MNELERWACSEGPMPASVRPMVEAMREADEMWLTDEEVDRAEARFFARLERRERGEEEEEGDEAQDSRCSGVVLARAAPAGAAPAEDAAEEAGAGFETWAALSIGLLGVEAAGKAAALGARGMTVEAWEEIDEGYLRLLSRDLLAGRTERPEHYAARCKAEMAWRRAGAASARGGAEGRAERGDEGAAHPKPAVVRAPARMTGTAEAVELPAELREAMGRLPFKAPVEGAALAGLGRGQAVAKTQPVQVMSGPGDTLPVGDDAIEKAVAALPFVGDQGAAALLWFPALTVPQYVSLRMELQVRVAREGETQREGEKRTLGRYGVPSEASRRALMAHWEELAGRPEVRGEIDAAVGVWVAWATGWWWRR